VPVNWRDLQKNIVPRKQPKVIPAARDGLRAQYPADIAGKEMNIGRWRRASLSLGAKAQPARIPYPETTT
jgi:hypothetical protein